jgi:hypothetical protein
VCVCVCLQCPNPLSFPFPPTKVAELKLSLKAARSVVAAPDEALQQEIRELKSQLTAAHDKEREVRRPAVRMPCLLCPVPCVLCPVYCVLFLV